MIIGSRMFGKRHIFLEILESWGGWDITDMRENNMKETLGFNKFPLKCKFVL